jgi:hypothetical protein
VPPPKPAWLSFLSTAFSGQRGEHSAAPWTAFAAGGHHAFANRLKRDGAYLERVARVVFGCTPEVFRADAQGWLDTGLAAHRRGLYARSLANLRFE